MSTTLFPVGGRDIVERMCNKFPELHVNEDAKQRELTKRINQQLNHTFGPKHGGKVRSGLDPETQASKDSAAVLESDGTCSVWDLFQGNAEATILVQDNAPPTHANMGDEATFITYAPHNWLGDGGVPKPEPPPSGELEERVRRLEVENQAQETKIGELQYQNGLQQAQVDELLARMASLEGKALTSETNLRVHGRTNSGSFPRHWHDVDLAVTVEG